jgi:DUF4097 and DUF4098 domain-containing protein YvlB
MMKYTKIITALSLSTLMCGCIVIASSPSRANFHQQEELTLDARTLTAMDIDVGSGSLTIQGEAGLTEIRVTADIYTDKNNSDDYELTLTKSANTSFLVAKNNSTSGFWVGDSPHIDITIHLPEYLALDIEDGSGSIEVNDILGKLDIRDGSGNITVKNIGSDTYIHDGSGEIEVSQINGKLDIVDGSGEINIEDVKGNLTIDDGSGTIYATNITGNANIDDGSGDLTVKQVTGIVTVDDGSGNININDAGGLKILDSGSGGLKVNNVKGDFEIDS